MTDQAMTVGAFEGSSQEWDAFVASHPDGRFCQLTAYLETVNAVYGFAPRRCAIRREGRLVGLLAASMCRSPLFGRKWVSVPYGEYGGFLLEPSVESDAAARLVAVTREAAMREGAIAVELNGVLGLPAAVASAFALAVPYQIAVLDLLPGPDYLIDKAFKYEVRKAIRKAERAALTTRERSDADTIRNVFYPLWLDSMRRLGVPPHGPNYFVELKARFGADLGIVWTERAGRPVAALMGVRAGARVQVIATASRPEDWQDRPNDLAHWAYVRLACETGARWFDFGSVRYEGQRHYKEKWAARIEPAAHWVLHLRRRSLPATFDSSSGTMDVASRIWRSLVPNPVARRIGPLIRRVLVR